MSTLTESWAAANTQIRNDGWGYFIHEGALWAAPMSKDDQPDLDECAAMPVSSFEAEPLTKDDVEKVLCELSIVWCRLRGLELTAMEEYRDEHPWAAEFCAAWDEWEKMP